MKPFTFLITLAVTEHYGKKIGEHLNHQDYLSLKHRNILDANRILTHLPKSSLHSKPATIVQTNFP